MARKKMTAAEKAEAEGQKMLQTLKAIAENHRDREKSIVNQLGIGLPDYPAVAEENENPAEEAEAMSTFEETIHKLGKNYEHMEGSIVNQLFMQTPAHPPTTGSYRETVWQALLRQIIPQKFYIDQGVFIIDAHNHISKEVDLAVFDEQYTPYIFNYGEIKFIPIEAVAMVVQCKSENVSEGQLKAWTDSIECLMPSFDSVARIATDLLINDINHPESRGRSTGKCTQTATRPILMLCAAANGVSDKVRQLFDIILIKSKTGTALQKFIRNEEKDLSWWYKELNHYDLARYGKDSEEVYKQLEKQVNETKRTLLELRVGEGPAEENVVLSLVFQLNQLLMLLNNPMLFPHRAYAKMFDDILKTGQITEAKGGPAHG